MDLHIAADDRQAALRSEARHERLVRPLRGSRGASVRRAAGRALIGLGEHLLAEQHRAPEHRGAG
ncbi:MAG: hypothetical protein ACRDUY_09370 [Nitriliruptorales bacterium]